MHKCVLHMRNCEQRNQATPCATVSSTTKQLVAIRAKWDINKWSSLNYNSWVHVAQTARFNGRHVRDANVLDEHVLCSIKCYLLGHPGQDLRRPLRPYHAREDIDLHWLAHQGVTKLVRCCAVHVSGSALASNARLPPKDRQGLQKSEQYRSQGALAKPWQPYLRGGHWAHGALAHAGGQASEGAHMRCSNTETLFMQPWVGLRA